MFAGLSSASAQHSHDAPHGGTLQEAGGYHIEMVKTKDTLSFYVMDGSNKTISKAVTGSLQFEFSNKTKSTTKLVSCKAGGLCTPLPKANIFEYCTATFKVDGKTFSTKFKNSVSDAQKAHGHEH
ncbi:MAG: hypothetical protein BGO53_09675 [Sphingobacteriales bacterium 39-19]|nr:MAG: hypothetical protein BGO53_09675 [Sphingobacteriales bacterium 39-19]